MKINLRIVAALFISQVFLSVIINSQMLTKQFSCLVELSSAAVCGWVICFVDALFFFVVKALSFFISKYALGTKTWRYSFSCKVQRMSTGCLNYTCSLEVVTMADVFNKSVSGMYSLKRSARNTQKITHTEVLIQCVGRETMQSTVCKSCRIAPYLGYFNTGISLCCFVYCLEA